MLCMKFLEIDNLCELGPFCKPDRCLFQYDDAPRYDISWNSQQKGKQAFFQNLLSQAGKQSN